MFKRSRKLNFGKYAKKNKATNREEAAKLAHLLGSVSLKKSIYLKIMKKIFVE